MADLLIRELRLEREGRVILDAGSAEFPARMRTVLWGPSGAGKSTLLAAIAGLVVPMAGSIRRGDVPLFSKAEGIDVPPYERRIGFVFQDLALWPHLCALDQVRLVGAPAGLEPVGAMALLESVGLGALARRRPGELSGGEQQRLAIVRALAGKPEVLLMDEPFSAVDRKTRLALHSLLRELSPGVPGPTIYVTHSAEDARALAESVMSLEGGKLVTSERPWEADEAEIPPQ